LVDYDQQRIVFVSGTIAGDNIPPGSYVVDYDRSTPIIKRGGDRASITSYGPKTKVIQDKNIVDPQMARDVVISTLSQHSQPSTQGTIQLEGIVYLIAGQTIIVNMANQNISNETYDIIEARYEFTKKNCRSNQVLTIKVSKRLKDIADTIKQLILDIKKLQTEDMNVSDVYSRMEFATGSVGTRVSSWYVKTRTLGSSFILGHPKNGVLGSTTTSGVNYLGDSRSSLSNQQSGGTWT